MKEIITVKDKKGRKNKKEITLVTKDPYRISQAHELVHAIRNARVHSIPSGEKIDRIYIQITKWRLEKRLCFG